MEFACNPGISELKYQKNLDNIQQTWMDSLASLNSALPKHGKDDDFDGQELANGVEWLEQLPCAPVEIDEGVEGTGLRQAVHYDQVHPSIPGFDGTLGVNSAQLGYPKIESSTIMVYTT